MAELTAAFWLPERENEDTSNLTSPKRDQTYNHLVYSPPRRDTARRLKQIMSYQNE